MSVSVLIVDDHPVVRAGIRGMLEGQPDFVVVGEATNGEEALKLVGRLDPDVVLMELRMPGTDGVAATSRLRKQRPETRVLVLTTSDSGADILRAVEAGATGYVLKDAPREEIYGAIRAAAEGKPLLAPDVAARLVERVRWPSEEGLSGREVEVLELVARARETRRSRARSGSARQPSSPTSCTSTTSWAPPTGPRPSPPPCAAAS